MGTSNVYFFFPDGSDVLGLKTHIWKPLLWSCLSFHYLTPAHQHSPFLLSALNLPQGLSFPLAIFFSHCHPLPKGLSEYNNNPAVKKEMIKKTLKNSTYQSQLFKLETDP